MSEADRFHLTEDELDSLLGGIAQERALSHVATCPSCFELVRLDRELTALLASLPRPEPTPGFADLVIARVAPEPERLAVATVDPSRAVSARRRVLIGGGLMAAGLAAAFAWAAANPGASIDLADPLLAPLREAGWFSVQSILANATEQPWYSAVMDLLATPSSAVPLVTGAAATYVAMLAGFRRILSRPVADADW